jgi:isopentenyl diphosphate isomerase/L-lactate dehydrogenase-like FMN-dependent dehydrogenase
VSSFEGSSVAAQILLAQRADWPIEADDWEQAARELLEQGPFDYIAGGAGGESTLRANVEAFERRRLRPRVLTGAGERELSVEVLGTRSAAPFFLAPVGGLSIAHAEAERACGRAAAAAGIPFVVSTAGSTPLEEVGAEMGGAARWFQLYWPDDRELAASFVARAQAAGYAAIVLTVDTGALGWRTRDLRNGYSPTLRAEGCAQFFSDPVFRSRLERPPEEDTMAAVLAMVQRFPHHNLTWRDLEWLRGELSVPLLLKGIVTAEDALLAVEHGVDGIVVSNHGGRQVDGAVAALDALLEVRAAAPAGFPVLMDGGIRRGADVIKALALGADAVLIGRLYAYGLAVGGQAGVEAVIRQLLAEVDLTLGLCGRTSVRELDPSLVAAPTA